MGYDLTVTGPAMRTVIDLRLQLETPVLPPWPLRPNSRSVAGGKSLLWLGPSHWLLVAPPEDEDALLTALPRDGVTLWSDSLLFLEIGGADAGVAMAIACPLDLHPSAFAKDDASWTDVFGTRALVLRAPDGWMLGVDPSHADYIVERLARIR